MAILVKKSPWYRMEIAKLDVVVPEEGLRVTTTRMEHGILHTSGAITPLCVLAVIGLAWGEA